MKGSVDTTEIYYRSDTTYFYNERYGLTSLFFTDLNLGSDAQETTRNVERTIYCYRAFFITN